MKPQPITFPHNSRWLGYKNGAAIVYRVVSCECTGTKQHYQEHSYTLLCEESLDRKEVTRAVLLENAQAGRFVSIGTSDKNNWISKN